MDTIRLLVLHATLALAVAANVGGFAAAAPPPPAAAAAAAAAGGSSTSTSTSSSTSSSSSSSSSSQQAWGVYKVSSSQTTLAASAAGSGQAAAGFTASAALAAEVLPEYGPSFKQLTVQATPETPARLRVKIAPPGEQRWEVPEFIVQRPGPSPAALAASPALYSVAAPAAGDPLAVTVTRSGSGSGSSSSGGAPVFDTRGSRLVFKDQYIELTTAVPADADLYGLGEVTLPTGFLLPRDGRVLTLYNRDLPSAVPYANLYGSHPFYLQVNKDGSSHGVFLLNSNGMDVILNETSLTFKVIGGLVDLYFFMGPTPEEVVRQYHEVIGAPMMPPYWALGAHQGRWGYPDIATLEQVVSNYSAAGVPLEGLWVDIEYMAGRFWTLTLDENRFSAPRMRKFVAALHADGRHWVPIHDAGVAKARGYKAYEDGTSLGVWIRDRTGLRPYLGQVWPGETVYPDYLSGGAAVDEWTRRQVAALHAQVPYDGLWLDMNEASNFCSGDNCRADGADRAAAFWLEAATPHDYNLTSLIKPRTTCQMVCEQAAPDDPLAHPPYKIHNFYWDAAGEVRDLPISTKVIAPTALHSDGVTREYDAHNLYGTSMALRHYPAFANATGRRPFQLLRSTFPGAGRVTGHWTGDNAANWQSFYESTGAILTANLWGVAMTGADVCGFVDMAPYDGRMGDPPNVTLPDAQFRELCNRWTSAGAFYPFLRNHMTYFTRPHEPYRWPDVAAAARKAYGLRYRLLTYLYSAMFVAHTRGGTFARPLLFTDPSDAALRNASRQWMMGDALLVSPVMAFNTTKVDAHFTRGAWYSAWDYAPLLVAKGQPVTLDVPLGDVAVHLRGGAVVPMQPYAAVTRDVRLGDVTLVVALPVEAAGAAAASGVVPPYAHEEPCVAARARNPAKLVSCGLLFMDGGADLDVGAGSGLQVWYTAVAAPGGRSGTLTGAATSNAGDAKGKIALAAVHVLGVAPNLGNAAPKVLVNGKPLPAGAGAAYDARAGVLRVSGLRAVVGEPLEVSWTL